MEEIKNLTQDDVLELISDFPITPLRNKVIITTNMDEYEDDDLDLSGSAFSPTQYILAVGSHCRDLKPGQKIYLDLEAMSVSVPNPEDVYQPEKRLSIKPVDVGDKVYGIITDSKIEYLINN